MSRQESRFFPAGPEGQSQREFGDRATRVGRIQFDLDNARDDIEVEIGGTWLWLVTTSGADVEIDIKFQDRTTGKIPYKEGTFIRPGPFSRIFLSHTAQAGETVTLLYGTGDPKVENPGTIFRNVVVTDVQTPLPSSNGINTRITLVKSTDVAEILVPANPNRRQAIIRAAHTDTLNAGETGILIGGSAVNSSNGIPLTPGDSITLETTADIYWAVDNGGDNMSAHVIEIEDT